MQLILLIKYYIINDNQDTPLSKRPEKAMARLWPGSRPQITAARPRPGKRPEIRTSYAMLFNSKRATK